MTKTHTIALSTEVLENCPKCDFNLFTVTSIGQCCVQCGYEHYLTDVIIEKLEQHKYYTPKRSSWKEY